MVVNLIHQEGRQNVAMVIYSGSEIVDREVLGLMLSKDETNVVEILVTSSV